MPSRTRVNVGAGGGGSFLTPGSPFDPQRIAYMGLGAAAFHEVLRGYLLARYQKLEKLSNAAYLHLDKYIEMHSPKKINFAFVSDPCRLDF